VIRRHFAGSTGRLRPTHDISPPHCKIDEQGASSARSALHVCEAVSHHALISQSIVVHVEPASPVTHFCVVTLHCRPGSHAKKLMHDSPTFFFGVQAPRQHESSQFCGSHVPPGEVHSTSA